MNYPKYLPALEWKAPANIEHFGYYAVVAPVVTWANCRERFQSNMSNPAIRQIYFSVRKEDSRYAVASFIHKTETILGVKRKTTYNELYKKDGKYYNQVLQINIARFWKADYCRSSLFTALLRIPLNYSGASQIGAGVPYDPEKDNYEECLYNDNFFKLTPVAIKRFLCGHTKYTGAHPYGNDLAFAEIHTTGWYALMNEVPNGTNKGEGWKMLANPRELKSAETILAPSRFWR